MPFRSSQHTEDVCLVLDIGNASLAVSLVLFVSGSVPEALYTIRLPLAVTEHAHPEKLQSILSSQLELALRSVVEVGLTHEYFTSHAKHIAKVLCVFASPWYASRTKHVTVSNDKPFFVTKEFLNDVLTKEVTLFESELTQGLHGEEFKTGVVVMEKIIADVRINGYSIQQPIGHKTKAIETTLYIGIGSEELVARIADQISRFFHTTGEDIIIHSFPLVAHTALLKIYPPERHYIICDVTGEVTDLTLVTNGTIKHTASFPIGKFFLIRKIAQVMGVPREVAQSLLTLWQTDASHAESAKKIESIVADVEREWSVYFEDALTSLGDIGTLPQKVFLTVDTDIAPLFIQFFTTAKTDLTTSWRKNVSVVHLSESALKDFYVSPKTVLFDECIALESIFLSLFK